LNYSAAPGLVVRFNFPAVNALEYFRWRQPENGFPACASSKPSLGICQLRLTQNGDRSIFLLLLDFLGAPDARQNHFKS